MDKAPYILEICAGNVTWAVDAARAGADRIELVDNFHEGGTTPSPGTVHEVVKEITKPVMVMLRPRGGHFVYSETEFRVMLKDLEWIRESGATGIVTGLLTPGNEPDLKRCECLLKHSGHLQVTFHRAFDQIRNPFTALEKLAELGFHRILTSGGPGAAEHHLQTLSSLIHQANEKIIVMPGGGIRSYNLPGLLEATHAREVHMAPVIPEAKAEKAFQHFPSPDLQEIHKVYFFLQSLIHPSE